MPDLFRVTPKQLCRTRKGIASGVRLCFQEVKPRARYQPAEPVTDAVDDLPMAGNASANQIEIYRLGRHLEYLRADSRCSGNPKKWLRLCSLTGTFSPRCSLQGPETLHPGMPGCQASSSKTGIINSRITACSSDLLQRTFVVCSGWSEASAWLWSRGKP